MTNPEILNKIKYLQNLAKSDNENEAATAANLASKLIEKYQLSEEEVSSLTEKESPYGENERIFSMTGLILWKQQLILAIGDRFDCKIVQEDLAPNEGEHQYVYFALGEPEAVIQVKAVYSFLSDKTEEMFRDRLVKRGPVYCESYQEGFIEEIKDILFWDEWEPPKFPGTVLLNKEGKSEQSKSNLVVQSSEAKKVPIKESTQVSKSLIKDSTAYFRGMTDANLISLKDIFKENLLK